MKKLFERMFKKGIVEEDELEASREEIKNGRFIISVKEPPWRILSYEKWKEKILSEPLPAINKDKTK